MSLRLVSIRSLLAASALLVATSFAAPPAAAQGGYASCGEIVRGVTCLRMFRDDGGQLWLLEDFGSFQVGDRVFVTGTADRFCMTICMQGNGCIFNNTISDCSLTAPSKSGAADPRLRQSRIPSGLPFGDGLRLAVARASWNSAP